MPGTKGKGKGRALFYLQSRRRTETLQVSTGRCDSHARSRLHYDECSLVTIGLGGWLL